MAFENIPRRFQRWKVIMVPGAKSYESWDEMVTGENFSEETGVLSGNPRKFRHSV
uniref:hypothetical protein n=1 Tax=Citrobacter freundii TaxID=546 RepID=UPI0029C73686|nr:hypothetical protein [Citrobacter freundii]WOL93185.1 hypothetical protein LKDNAJBN_00019 [Citrobacter freundii]